MFTRGEGRLGGEPEALGSQLNPLEVSWAKISETPKKEGGPPDDPSLPSPSPASPEHPTVVIRVSTPHSGKVVEGGVTGGGR